MKNEHNHYQLSKKEYDRTILLAQGHTHEYVAGKEDVDADAIYKTVDVLKKRFNVHTTNSLFFILGAKGLIPADIIMEGMQSPKAA